MKKDLNYYSNEIDNLTDLLKSDTERLKKLSELPKTDELTKNINRLKFNIKKKMINILELINHVEKI